VTHAADNLPANIVDVVNGILKPFEWEPTAVVNSGGGIHAYWLFEQPLAIGEGNRAEVEEMSRAFQERLAMGARANNWKFDMTADTPRVLRVVGTHNRKSPEHPLLVDFMVAPSGNRYAYSLFQKALKTKAGGIKAIIGREPSIAPPGPLGPLGPLGPPGLTEPPGLVDPRSDEDVLVELRTKMRKCRKEERRQIISLILEGEPFARMGERDQTLQRVCSWIAFYDQIADPEILVEVLRPSLEVMAAAQPDGAMTIDDAIEKIARAQHDARRKGAVASSVDENIRRALAKQARGIFEKPKKAADLVAVPGPPSPTAKPSRGALPLDKLLGLDRDRNTPASLALVPTPAGTASEIDPSVLPEAQQGERYSIEEINQIIEKQKALSGVAVITHKDWKNRWVIIFGDSLFVYTRRRYSTPISSRFFLVAALKDLFCILPEYTEEGRYYFKPYTINNDGAKRDKSTDEVLKEIASVARALVADLTLSESYYNSDTDTFHEAVCPLRDLEPRYDPDIQQWLELIAGGPPLRPVAEIIDEEGRPEGTPERPEARPRPANDTDRLLDWIASVTYLDAPSCGLFLSGPPGTGKSLLANGLSRIWHHGGYTRMEDVVGAFNGDLLKCPLVVADEELPEGPGGKRLSTRRLRDIISADTRSLRRKFVGNVALRGTVRCMFLANSEDMLDLGDESLGTESMEAVASRFLHIETTKASADFINALGGRHGGTKEWVSGDLIARHALWLRDNRHVIPDGRFWVQGHVTKMHQLLATASNLGGTMAEWLVHALTTPKAAIKAMHGVLFGNGQLWVRVEAIANHWQEFIRSRSMPPSMQMLKRPLKGLCLGPAERLTPAVGKRYRYWPINTDFLLAWARDHGVDDIDNLRALLDTPATSWISDE
jgi:hypothetical protein